MTWPESLADDLPAPRDDEPESLRRDIADELADHLDCALRKELHATPDKEQARRQVLQRFGDPKTIARRLWFDALKEKIMSQRIMLALAVVMTVACLVAAGLVRYAIDGGSTAMAALVADNRAASEAARAANEANRAANEALLARMEELATAMPPRSPEWSNFSVKLTPIGGEPPMPPGLETTLRGNVLEPGKETTITAVPGADGIADFGLVRTGRHKLTVKTPFAQKATWDIDVRPGLANAAGFDIPTALPAKAEISCSIDWPADLRDKAPWVVCSLIPIPPLSREIGPTWEIGPVAAPPQMLAISPTGMLIDFQPPETPSRWDIGNYLLLDTNQRFHVADPSRFGTPASSSGGSRPGSHRFLDATPDVPGLRIVKGDPLSARVAGLTSPAELWFGVPNREGTRNLELAAVEYELDGILFLDPPEPAEAEIRELRIIGGMLDRYLIGRIDQETFFSARANARNFSDVGGGPTAFDRFVVLRPEERKRLPVVAGQPNHWRITLPDELLKLLREQIVARNNEPESDSP